MKIFNTILSTLLVVLFFLVLGAACYYVVVYAINIFKGLDATVVNILYAALAVGILVMILSSMIGKRLEMRDKNRQIFPRKCEVYQKFIMTWSDLIRNNEVVGDNLSKLNNDLENTEKEFMLLASAGVIKKYIQLQSCKNEPNDYLSVFGQFILEIRQDLGNSNVGLSSDKLASLFFEISLIDDQQNDTTLNIHKEVSVGV